MPLTVDLSLLEVMHSSEDSWHGILQQINTHFLLLTCLLGDSPRQRAPIWVYKNKQFDMEFHNILTCCSHPSVELN